MQHQPRLVLVLLLLCGCPATDNEMGNVSVGAACEVLTDASTSQGVFNTDATECPSRICLKPVVAPSRVDTITTGPFCTADCNTDSDCAGIVRDSANPSDNSCASGYACAIPFVKGRLCCRKLCLCKDFLDGDPVTPTGCREGAELTCGAP